MLAGSDKYADVPRSYGKMEPEREVEEDVERDEAHFSTPMIRMKL